MSLRDTLLDTAIDRFAEHGPGTSFDAIAADVGVTKGALYHHFGSKDGLVEEVYKEAIRRHANRVMEASAAGDGRTRLLALVDSSARLYSSRTPFYRLLTTLEGQWTRNRSAVLVQGVEGGIVTGGVGLVARAGYATRATVTDASRFTFGGGIVLGRLGLDYAFQGYDALGGGTHRVGIRWTP